MEMDFDSHEMALNATNNLSAFENETTTPSDIVSSVREAFDADAMEVNQKIYHLLPSLISHKQIKWQPPPQWETPHILQNVPLNQLVFLLFERRRNLKGLLYQYYLDNPKYNIEGDFGISLAPFMNQVSPDRVAATIHSILPPDFDATNDNQYMQFLETNVDEIHQEGMLGSHRFLTRRTKSQQNIAAYRNAARSYIMNLSKQYQETVSHSNRNEVLQKIRQMLAKLQCSLQINALSTESLAKLNQDSVIRFFSDELACNLHLSDSSVSQNGDIDFIYTPRTMEYLDSGTRYGDCTSRNKEKQVDQTTNIFWTIASYAIDIFHQIQELKINGEPVLKTHLTPCFFKDEPALNIDAIETTLKIRRYKSNSKKDLNPACDEELFAKRKELFEATIERIKTLADAMGINTIICDGYSNTQWVRKSLETFRSSFYRITEYRSLYDGSFPNDFALKFSGKEIESKTEVQAWNESLQELGMQHGCKENCIIRGEVKDSLYSCIRGV